MSENDRRIGLRALIGDRKQGAVLGGAQCERRHSKWDENGGELTVEDVYIRRWQSLIRTVLIAAITECSHAHAYVHSEQAGVEYRKCEPSAGLVRKRWPRESGQRQTRRLTRPGPYVTSVRTSEMENRTEVSALRPKQTCRRP